MKKGTSRTNAGATAPSTGTTPPETSRTSAGATETNAGTIMTPTGTPRTSAGATEPSAGTTPTNESRTSAGATEPSFGSTLTVASRNGRTKTESCTQTNKEVKNENVSRLFLPGQAHGSSRIRQGVSHKVSRGARPRRMAAARDWSAVAHGVARALHPRRGDGRTDDYGKHGGRKWITAKR